MVLGPVPDESGALLAAWLPGTEREGVADVLFGDLRPTAKLPRDSPRSDQQLSVNELHGRPLFGYSFGLTC